MHSIYRNNDNQAYEAIDAVFCVQIDAVFCVQIDAVFCVQIDVVFCVQIDAVFCVQIDKSVEYSVKVSYIEIYKEELRDLLEPSSDNKQDLHVREDDKGNTGDQTSSKMLCLVPYLRSQKYVPAFKIEIYLFLLTGIDFYGIYMLSAF